LLKKSILLLNSCVSYSKVYTDEELIKGCIANDRHCQRALFEKYAGKMLAVCRRYESNHTPAEDLLQEGFIKIFKSISTFRNQGAFEGWIRRIIVNTALSSFRLPTAHYNQVDISEVKLNNAEASAIDRLSEKDLLQLIDSLPDGYKTVFNLYVIEGYSHKEIADLLKINEGTSRSQFSKAKNALQEKLKQSEITFA